MCGEIYKSNVVYMAIILNTDHSYVSKGTFQTPCPTGFTFRSIN